MATALEQTFLVACIVAEGARQSSKAAALATFAAAGFSSAAVPAFRTAILNADQTYENAVVAASAGNISPQPCLYQPFGGTNAFVQNTPGIPGGGE